MVANLEVLMEKIILLLILFCTLLVCGRITFVYTASLINSIIGYNKNLNLITTIVIIVLIVIFVALAYLVKIKVTGGY
jgi:hypothetical protein